MGMGWKVKREEEVSSRPCKCGKGLVKTIVDISESEMHMEEREGLPYKVKTCPDKCE